MKLTTTKAALLPLLLRAGKVIEKGPIPILGCALLETDKDHLSITATDMNVTLSDRIDVGVEVAGKVCVPLEELSRFVGCLPDGADVTIERVENSVKVTSGRNRCKIECLPADEFPEITERRFVCEMVPESFLEALKFCVPAIYKGEERPYLQGVYINGGDCLGLCASDGQSLHIVEIEAPLGLEQMIPAIIPEKSCKLALGVLEGDVLVRVGDVLVEMKAASRTLTTRLIDGTYPDYKRIIPQDSGHGVKVGRKSLLSTIERLAPVCGQGAYQYGQAIHLRPDLNAVTLAAVNRGRSLVFQEIPAMCEPSPAVAFHLRYILPTLRAMRDDEVELRIIDGQSPVRIEGKNMAIVMPYPREFPSEQEADEAA